MKFKIYTILFILTAINAVFAETKITDSVNRIQAKTRGFQ
jgi:hypothetical protein